MDNFWEETKSMFSQLFQKPKMSDKLLQKPPFKYIFDIIIETQQQTGYCQELYDNYELVSEYYDTKEKKLIFLEKIIDFTVIYGLEPENTNLMLQAIFRASVSGIAQGKQINNSYQQKRQQELFQLIQNFELLINSEQFQLIYNDNLYQKWKNELNQTKEQLEKNNIHLNIVQEKIETFKKIQSQIIDFININNE